MKTFKRFLRGELQMGKKLKKRYTKRINILAIFFRSIYITND